MIYGNPISLLCRCICRLNFRSRFAWSRGICINNVNAAAAAAKSLQSCPTLCDPIDGSPPGSLSLGFSRKEHWSGLPFPSPMHEGEKWKWSCSVLSDSERPHGLQPTGLLHPWDFPGKSTEVGCHRLLCNFNTRISLTTYLTEWLICCESLNFSNNCAIVEKYKGLFSF